MTDFETLAEIVFRKTRFLIIDDRPAALELIERYLLLGNALQVRKVKSPLEALRFLQDPRTPVDCVICSSTMTPLSGMEFLQNLRNGRYGSRPLSEVKFILLMKQRDEAMIALATSFRARGFIIGGFDRTSLTKSVFEALAPPAAQTPGAKTAAARPAQAANGHQSDDEPLVLQPEAAPAAAYELGADLANRTKLQVAHIREQGVDLIIVPLDHSFGQKPQSEQAQAIQALRTSATNSRMQGEVVPVWDSGGGAMAFIAPKGYHSYFRSISLQFVFEKLNRELYV